MPQIFNAKNLKFDIRDSPIADYALHASPFLSDIVHSKHLDFNIKSLDPQKYSCPYHFHRNSEELFVILSGKATLRIPNKFVEISMGDIIFFEIGQNGAHQLYNHTDKPCVYLDLGSENGIDICEYPDSGKINILPYRQIFQSDDNVDYYKDEGNPSENWPSEIISHIKEKY